MKRILLTIVSLLIVFLLASGGWYLYKKNSKAPAVKPAPTATLMRKLGSKSATLETYAKANNFNTELCFMIDMKIESGKNRFFIYDMKKDSVLGASLVTHGRCNETWLKGRKYGNEVGCGCTSLGKYKIGNPYHGKFGLAYKLHGLDATNSNAFKRYVVLHSHECVPNNEVTPYPICQSDGCPTVSADFLKKLAAIIDKSPKPVLLYIYE
ncbi:murein L,D-transpeptidase catalytic domain-containing protein [Pseudoflavitalea rhizosphaerae]|uniref:murein L,D-transpeptidase catalytic domain-containing protein n=1 Tax=Pseudoflavitalea rhizosphaerae TaxID=1884793 RepID=UPI000F8CB0E4|nr:murein L,D-transpeptidase catalytic domain family protein [Pseudoflavitalea rhizosphaerae]